MIRKEEFLDLVHLIGNAKFIKRSGWLSHDIDEVESMADHSFRLALIAMLFGCVDEKVDITKMIKMALIHDLPEIITGDITPKNNITKEEKRKLELDALEEVFGKFPCFNNIKDLLIEFENGSSNEALYLKDLDKLEMIIQAVDYKRMNPNLTLDEFIEYAESRISFEKVRTLFNIEKTHYDSIDM